MTGATIKTAQRAIDKAGIPLEIVRGEGYHYFVYDQIAANRFDTISVYIPYTSHQTPEQWAILAGNAWAQIQKEHAE